MEKKTIKRQILDYLLITAGTVIYGVGIRPFLRLMLSPGRYSRFQ